MADQVRIDFLVTANMSGMHKQVQALNAELMQTAGTVNLLDKNLSKLDVMSAHRQFGQMVTSSGMFDHQIVSLDTHTKQFADSLSRARLTGRQYWQESTRYMRGARTEIAALAREQVRMQNSVLTPMGRTASGQMTAGVTTPTGLASDVGTKLRVANKEWEIFNKVAQQGSTHMVNWGKNTQWAGRQLMVGFTVPLMIAGGLAAKTFKDLDEQLVRLTKVYGSGFTFGDEYAKQALVVRDAGMQMAKDMAAAYGQAGDETIALMADLAAIGLEGQDLARMTEQTTRLATLGEVDRQQAMDATISMQTAFKMSTEEVATSVNFLNAVENQTSATLGDLTTAIPRAGTVVKALGGNMEDLSLYMVAFREGGISAAEGANALKSGLSSIIAPPKAAIEFLKEFGINLPNIVNQNAGDLTGTILEFQQSLMGLDKLAQQQVITKLFGKYQFARMSAFFNNLGAKGSQTLDVMKLMGVEASTLQKAADQEIRAGAESASGQWDRQWNKFKVTIAEVGKEIIGWGTTVLKILNKAFGFIADNSWLLDIVKWGGLALAAIGPVVMMMGLFGNIIGTVLKGILRLINGFKAMTSGGGISKTFEMMTAESFAAENSIDMLTGSIYDQTKAIDVITQAAKEYAVALEQIATNSGIVAKTPAAGRALITPANLSEAEMATRPRTGSLGLALSTAEDNAWTKQFGSDTVSTARLAALPRNKLLGLGTTMTMAEQLSNRQLMLQYNGKPLSATSFADTVQQTKNSDLKTRVAAETKLNAIYEQNEKQLRDIWLAEEKILGTNAEQYALELKMREMRIQQLPGFKSSSPGQQGYTLGAGMFAAQLGGYNEGMMAPQSIFSDKVVKIFASQTDMLRPELEHLSAASNTLAQDMLEIARYEQQYGVDMQELRESTIRRALGLDDSAAGEERVQQVNAAFIESQSEAAAMYQMESKRVNDSASQRIKNDAVLSKSNVELAASSESTVKAQQSYLASLTKEKEDLSRNDIVFQEMMVAGQKYIVAVNLAATNAEEAFLGVTGINKAGNRTGKASAEAETAGRIFAEETHKGAVRSATTLVEGSKTAAGVAIEGARKGAAINVEGGIAEEAIEIEGAITETNIETSAWANYRPPGQTTPQPGQNGGLLGRFKGTGKMGMGLSSAAMMLPMLGTMVAPEGSVAGGVSQGAMYGSMVGMIGGPWGMVGGAVAGAAIAGIGEVMHKIAEDQKKEAAIAAAAWESEFGDIDIGIELQKQLKLNLDSFRIPDVDLSGSGLNVESASEKYSQAVAEDPGTKEMIEAIKLMSDGDAVNYGKRMFVNLIAGGAEASDALKLIIELMNQADKSATGLQIHSEVDVDLDEKKAQKQVEKAMSEIGAGASRKFVEAVASGEDEETWMEMGKNTGKAVFDSLQEAFDTGAIEPDKYFSELIKSAGSLPKTMVAEFDKTGWNELKKDTETLQYLSDEFGVATNSLKGFQRSFNALGDQDQSDVLETIRKSGKMWGDAGVSAEMFTEQVRGTNAATVEQLALIRASNPEIDALANRYKDLNQAENLEEATLMALKEARRQYNIELRTTAQLQSFIKSASKYLPDQPEKVNIAQMERQNEKELEMLRESESDKLDALQEAEDDRLQAMQDAADKRERLIEKEIKQTERAYDKEIRQIENAEAKRQEQMQAEEDRFARRQEMRNLGISYDEAVASGDMFEAARLRMDINATRKQQERDTAEEKRQKKVDKRIKALEKEKNAKVRALNQELRAEQKANEKMIESAQEASQAKIEAAQEASDAAIAAAERTANKEVKAAEEGNKEIEKNQQENNAALQKMHQQLLRGNIDAFKKGARDLGISVEDRSKMITDFVSKEFGYMPPKVLNALTQSIAGGNWKALEGIMEMAISGASKSEMKDYFDWELDYAKGGNPATRGTTGTGSTSDGGNDWQAGYASGGYVSGRGTGTSDSIPARLSDGEYVVRQKAVAKYGKSFFDRINNSPSVGGEGGGGRPVGFASGGMVGPIVAGMMRPIKDLYDKMKKGSGSVPGKSESFNAPGTTSSGKIVQWDGEPIDQLVAAQLKIAGRILGQRIGVTQGSYQPETSYSGKSHMGGGTIDTPPYGGMYGGGVRALQRAGFAAWWRGPQHGDWSPHIHAISLFSPNPSSTAAWQRQAYLDMSSNGLSGNSPYYGPHLAPIPGLRGMLPGLRSGGRINYDNTVANLHKGETVLTAPLTKKFENNIASGGNANYNVNVEVNNPTSDVDVTRAVMKALELREKKFGRNRVIR
jgi:TP901 family phage tail tape measure protein